MPYATPGTAELAANVMPFVQASNAVLLANHGSVSFGADLEQALWYAEILEHYCRVILLADRLGPLQQLSEDQLRKLEGTYGRSTSAHVQIGVG